MAVRAAVFSLFLFVSPVQLFDVKINILSPINNSTYENSAVFAEVDLQIGSGELSDSIRLSPSSFELCITWDVGLLTGAIDDDDFIYCRNILQVIELPNLIPSKLAGQWANRVFRAWLRDRRLIGPNIAPTEVPYQIRSNECVIGVCLSGTMRTFVASSIRTRFIAAMESLAGDSCRVEVLAHVSTPSNLSSRVSASWVDDGTGGGTIAAFEASGHQIDFSIASLNSSLQNNDKVKLVTVKWFDESEHYAVPNSCPSDLPPQQSYPQLYKAASCFYTMAIKREIKLGFRYSWIVRARYDLVWLRPPPPLDLLSREAVSLSYAFWPISDQFAVMPRHLAEGYFTAINSFYACTLPEQASWYLPGQVGTEILLYSHLANTRVPFTFIEVNSVIGRATQPQSWCSIRQTVQLPCLILTAIGATTWLPEECARYYVASPGETKRAGPPSLLQRDCLIDFDLLSQEIGVRESLEEVVEESVEVMSIPWSRDSVWMTRTGRLAMDIDFVRGAHSPASNHIMRVSTNPSNTALRELAAALHTVVAEWNDPLEEKWYENRRHSAGDRKLASALARVLRNAKYDIVIVDQGK